MKKPQFYTVFFQMWVYGFKLVNSIASSESWSSHKINLRKVIIFPEWRCDCSLVTTSGFFCQRYKLSCHANDECFPVR